MQALTLVTESAVVSCVLGVSGPAGQQAFRALGIHAARDCVGAWASSSPLPSKATRRWPPRAPRPACPRSRSSMAITETAGTVGSSVQRTSHARIERSVTNFACEHRTASSASVVLRAGYGLALPVRRARRRRRRQSERHITGRSPRRGAPQGRRAHHARLPRRRGEDPGLVVARASHHQAQQHDGDRRQAARPLLEVPLAGRAQNFGAAGDAQGRFRGLDGWRRT